MPSAVVTYLAGSGVWRSMRDGSTVAAVPPVLGTGKGLGFVGDSVSKQAPNLSDSRNALLAQGWPDTDSTRVDAVTGRSIVGPGGGTPLTRAVIASWRAGGFDPGSWVFPLGLNDLGDDDATWTSKIGSVLDEVASGPQSTYRVFWPGMTFAPAYNDSRSRRFFAVLQAVKAQRTGSKIDLRVFDYDAAFHNGRNESTLWNTGDTTGRHMTVAGYAVRNSLISAWIGGPV